jgi:hypothetical protein
MSAREFREYADACIAWAKTAKSYKECRDFLRMAQAWLEAADLSDLAPAVAQRTPPTLDLSR